MPDLLLWLCAWSKASFSPGLLILVLSSGPIVPHQLGLVRRGPVWQAGRAVSAGAPGVSPCGVESRGGQSWSPATSPCRGGEWEILLIELRTNFTGLKDEKLLGRAQLKLSSQGKSEASICKWLHL